MRRARNLESKLAAYEALSGDAGVAGKRRPRNWAVYATAAGSGLALATSADAGNIAYSGVQDLTITAAPGGFAFASLLLNNAAIGGIELHQGAAMVAAATRCCIYQWLCSGQAFRLWRGDLHQCGRGKYVRQT